MSRLLSASGIAGHMMTGTALLCRYRINALVEQEVKRRLFEERVQREKERRMERERERQERDSELARIRKAHDKELQRLRDKYEAR